LLTDNALELIDRVFLGSPKIIVTKPLRKSEKYFKIVIERKYSKDRDYFQFSKYYEDKVLHDNILPDDASGHLLSFIYSYKQCDIYSESENYKILLNGSNCKLIKSRGKAVTPEASGSHNKQKRYILEEGVPVNWLISLGISDETGRVLSHGQKKFRQINRFLEMISDVNQYLPTNANIVDFGCGKAYLTFAMYYYFNILQNKNISITGLDLKSDVVENCNRLAGGFGYSRLRFICGDIANYEPGSTKIHMAISLHACDTATDYAIYNAVLWNADVIMAVPCCQHELFAQIKNPELDSILRHGILKERFASTLTDAIRALTLEIAGYKTSVMEFIDLEHTPKNILIRAIKRTGDNEKTRNRRIKELNDLIERFKVSPKIYELFRGTLDL